MTMRQRRGVDKDPLEKRGSGPPGTRHTPSTSLRIYKKSGEEVNRGRFGFAPDPPPHRHPDSGLLTILLNDYYSEIQAKILETHGNLCHLSPFRAGNHSMWFPSLCRIARVTSSGTAFDFPSP